MLAILPQICLAAGGFFLFCIGAFWRRRPSALLFLIALTASAAGGVAAASISLPESAYIGMADVGKYARFFNVLICAITFIALLFSHKYSEIKGFSGDEFYAIVLFAALGMSFTAAAVNWIIFFLGLELLSISLYVLIAVNKEAPVSSEAGLKYLMMGAVATAFLTFGISLLYAVTGSMDIAASLGEKLPPSPTPVVMLALILILTGIGFKISIAPFHLWTPDVYEGAPAPVTAFLSTGSKVSLFAALIRFSTYLADPVWNDCIPVLWVLAALTMAVGNITALSQSKLKRLLAYSSIAQIGYLFMTLVAVKHAGAVDAMLFYLAIYAIMDLGAFGILGTLSGGAGDLDLLEDFRGLGYSNPWRSGILATCLVSLAGLPPMAGFMGKFVLFRAVLNANFLVLAAVGIATVIISIFFYLKVVVSLYMHPKAEGVEVPESDFSNSVACGIVLVVIYWLGIAPAPFFGLIGRIFPLG